MEENVVGKSQEVIQGNKKEFGLETFVFIAITFGILGYLAYVMGIGPMFSTIMKTSYSLLIETVLYVTAICVIMGAVGALLAEFGVVALMQKIISPIMRPIYGLPGAASLGVITTFLSDNPAVIALSEDRKIRKYFKKFEIAALCNIGTSFGMGLIVCTYMIGLGSEFASATLIGFLGAVVGSIVSTRLMLWRTKKHYRKTGEFDQMNVLDDSLEGVSEEVATTTEVVEKQSIFSRVMNTMLEGGKSGVTIGVGVTPGILCICTTIMILTFGPSTVDGVAQYTGAAYEGIELLPKFGELISPITKVLFGFQDGSNIAFPITSLGAVGAAMGLVPSMLEKGLAGGNEIAVFTAMGMCWSGYLSTHISMMDALKKRELISSAIIAHTIGGIAAGIAAHYIFIIF